MVHLFAQFVKASVVTAHLQVHVEGISELLVSSALGVIFETNELGTFFVDLFNGLQTVEYGLRFGIVIADHLRCWHRVFERSYGSP